MASVSSLSRVSGTGSWERKGFGGRTPGDPAGRGAGADHDVAGPLRAHRCPCFPGKTGTSRALQHPRSMGIPGGPGIPVTPVTPVTTSPASPSPASTTPTATRSTGPCAAGRSGGVARSGPGVRQCTTWRRGSTRTISHPGAITLEDHPPEQGGDGIVDVHDGPRRPPQGVEGAGDQVFARLGQYLNGHVIGDVAAFDQLAPDQRAIIELVLRNLAAEGGTDRRLSGRYSG